MRWCSFDAEVLQVAVLNYCRALSPKALALLVNHARHLRKLEIYGKHNSVGGLPFLTAPKGLVLVTRLITAPFPVLSGAQYL